MEARLEETKRLKELLKAIHCFKGPVHRAFVYTYYHSYTQNTDVYNYALSTNKQTHFTRKEFFILEHERRPYKLNFFLLFKVIQNCCSPTLAEPNDSKWAADISETCSHSCRVEQILVFLANSYQNFLHNAAKLSIVEIGDLIETLCCNVILLIQKSAEFSNSKRWTEERDNMQKMFSDIKNGDLILCRGNLSDVVRAEAEFRTDLYVELLSQELNNVDMSSWHLQCCMDAEGDDTADSTEYSKNENVEAGDILKIMVENRKRICWISGEHGVGKSSFTALIASSWSLNDKEVLGLEKFSCLFVVSLNSLEHRDENDLFQSLLPLTSLMISNDLLESWLKDESVLIIFDDVNIHSERIIKQIYEAHGYYSNLTVWFMGRISSILCYLKNTSMMNEAVLFELKGFKEERVLSLSKELYATDSEISLNVKLKTNMNRLGYVLKYPSIAFMAFRLWKENSHVFKNIYTASDLMWEILHCEVKQKLKSNIKKIGPARKKFLSWLMLAGELALYSLKADLRLDKQSLEELETEITLLYKENGRDFLKSFFKPTICHSLDSCFTIRGSTSKPLLEYFSSWFFIDQLIQNKQMGQLTNGLVNQLPLILFAAGHLERFQDEGSITIPEERKVIRALVTYRENSYEDFSFIQKFVAELKCIKRLVEIVIDETEYNEEWNLNVSEIQHKSLQVLLNHVSPTRLILLTDDSKKNYEMLDIIKFICRVKKISVWLDSIQQFNYGHNRNLDNLLKPFLTEIVAPKVDLISGCLSSSMLGELHKFMATQHLVLLKLKVSSNKHLNDTLNVRNCLPHLLWLEIKVDMNFSDIEVSSIEAKQVPLFDIHLREINETNVTFVADLLTGIQLRCTGIHLEKTTLTPEGVFTLLKELSKRGVILYGDEESILRFRLWYYPSLSSFPKWKTPTEKECLELIGHDDREFFSDHHVTSSGFVTAIDAWNLRNYLETQKNIIHFVYEASNIIFKKCLDGHVKIRFKGDYKETIEDKVLDKGVKYVTENDIANHVLEFF